MLHHCGSARWSPPRAVRTSCSPYPLAGPNIHRFLELQRAFPVHAFAPSPTIPPPFTNSPQPAVAHRGEIALLIDLNVGIRTGILPLGPALSLIAESTPAWLHWDGLHAYDGHLAIADPIARARQ